jgi:hypothetical protein
MATGHVDKETSIKEFIDTIMSNAESILKNWGFMGDQFTSK